MNVLRALGLVLLWICVAGFGMFTLCSGAFALSGELVFWLMTAVGAALTWGCFVWARSLGKASPDDDEARRRDPNHGAQP